MQLEIFLKSSVYCTSFKDLYWKLCKYEEAYYYDFPLYTKGWHEIFMSINSFVILTYCLSDLINFIQFQFYYRPCHLMMARVIVLLACIFILSKSKHGGLYRWRENSLPFFYIKKLKEILTRYSRTNLTPLKIDWFP